MALSRAQKQRAMEWYLALPGKRGLDIPAETFDMIHAVGNSITVPLWGRELLPHQVQWLYDNGAHTPDKIHQAIGMLQHPHAPNVRVGEFQDYSHALETYREHR